MENTKEKKVLRKLPPNRVASMVETIYGCKWSLTVYALLKIKVNRPGEMVRRVEGLTTKVLNSCLKRNVEFGILTKEVFPELPPRVEYSITNFGQQFVAILEQIEALNEKVTEPVDS